tara:strand:- start:237 stop:1133 length:897 start_codon:yes stop_codon:yes gene_type:complete
MAKEGSGLSGIFNYYRFKSYAYIFIFIFFSFAVINIWYGILFLILSPILLIIINLIRADTRKTIFQKEKEENPILLSGYEKYSGGMFADAICDYDSALEINPNNPSVYLYRSMAKLNMNDNDGAIKDATKSIELSDQNINIRFKGHQIAGIAKFNLGNFKDAISSFNIAIEISSEDLSREDELDNSIVYVQRGNCYRELGEEQKALNDYQARISINSYCEEALSGIGIIASSFFKDDAAAIEYFNKAILSNSENPFHYLKRGISKQALGDSNGACEDWKKASELGDVDAAELLKEHCE